MKTILREEEEKKKEDDIMFNFIKTLQETQWKETPTRPSLLALSFLFTIFVSFFHFYFCVQLIYSKRNKCNT
jgi:hypothetical protein